MQRLAPIAEATLQRLGLRRFIIRAIEPTLVEYLRDNGLSLEFAILARNEGLAWSKFCTQYFGALKPNPIEYNIE